jgi:hypothetical protein
MSIWRIRVNIRMIYILTLVALSLFKILDNKATPCSVKQNGA